MEIYKARLIKNQIINYTDFVCEISEFLKETIGKTNPTYFTSFGFGFVLNKGRKVKVEFNRIYTNSYKLIIKLYLFENDGNNYTTLVIPLKPTLTEELKEELEYFVEQYLKENNI